LAGPPILTSIEATLPGAAQEKLFLKADQSTALGQIHNKIKRCDHSRVRASKGCKQLLADSFDTTKDQGFVSNDFASTRSLDRKF
jgi:hypothetical protein